MAQNHEMAQNQETTLFHKMAFFHNLDHFLHLGQIRAASSALWMRSHLHCKVQGNSTVKRLKENPQVTLKKV